MNQRIIYYFKKQRAVKAGALAENGRLKIGNEEYSPKNNVDKNHIVAIETALSSDAQRYLEDWLIKSAVGFTAKAA